MGILIVVNSEISKIGTPTYLNQIPYIDVELPDVANKMPTL